MAAGLLLIWISMRMLDKNENVFPLQIGVVFSEKHIRTVARQDLRLVAGKQRRLVLGEQVGFVARHQVDGQIECPSEK